MIDNNDKLYEVEVEVTARGTVTAKVYAESAEEAASSVERLGVAAFDCDWDEFLNLAYFDVDVMDDPVEVVSEKDEQ